MMTRGAPNTTSRHGHDPTKIDHAWAVVGYVADSRQEAQRLLRTTLPPWLTASLQSYVFLRPGDSHREDVQTFLRLILRTQGLPAGYARAWAGEMDALLQQGQPFTLVFLDTREEESHEDRELRASGSRRTRRHLRRPNAPKRLAKRAQSAVLGKAFGLRFLTGPTIPLGSRALCAQVCAGGDVTLHSRYAEDASSRAIERGVSQYVILGAGLGLFAYRSRGLAGLTAGMVT